jgi:hypothetical protein
VAEGKGEGRGARELNPGLLAIHPTYFDINQNCNNRKTENEQSKGHPYVFLPLPGPRRERGCERGGGAEEFNPGRSEMCTYTYTYVYIYIHILYIYNICMYICINQNYDKKALERSPRVKRHPKVTPRAPKESPGARKGDPKVTNLCTGKMKRRENSYASCFLS